MMSLQCISPIDGSVYAERTALGADQGQDAVARARFAQKDWAQVPLEQRISIVMAGVTALGEMSDEIVPELAWQMGRPGYGGEFGGVSERASYMASIAKTALAPVEVGNNTQFHRYIWRVPQGVVFVIAPWNYPYMTAINTVVPALISGNAVLLKHAVQTLPVGERMERAFLSAGLPDALFQNVFLTHDVAETLIADSQFDFTNFTGSVAGGQAVERAAAGTFTPVATELGGKDPGYVMEDANLDVAVETLIDGAMFNSGQCCCGIERIYVHETLFDRFVEMAVGIVQGNRLGNPLDPDTTLGPMAHERFAATARSHIDEAVAAGATAHIARFEADDDGAYLTPQILTGVNHDMRIMKEETFGPAVGIMPVASDAEAVSLINDSNYGLTASLWTNDPDRAITLGNQIETGTVFLNRADYLDPALCWSGCKQSGRGAGLSELGFHAVTRPKSYHLKKALS